MAKKPVPPGRNPKSRKPKDKPTPGEKANAKAKLVSKGVPAAVAANLVGEGEDLSAKEIAERRVEWQQTLPKG